MPHYDYHCSNCGHKEELLQRMTEEPLNQCPQCHKETFIRQFGMGIGLQFQGSGFYCTDYCEDKTSSATAKKEPAPSATPGCGCGKQSCSS